MDTYTFSHHASDHYVMGANEHCACMNVWTPQQQQWLYDYEPEWTEKKNVKKITVAKCWIQ